MESMTSTTLPSRNIPQSNGLIPKPISTDMSAPGLLRQLSTQRKSLQSELNEFRNNLVGKEV